MPKIRTVKRQLGDFGENLACKYYEKLGYEIIGRNVTISQVGEIDVIASKTNHDSAHFIFIEVKTRRGNKFGDGYEAITPKKKLRMRSCAISWLRVNAADLKHVGFQLDVVTIALIPGKEPQFKVYANIEV